MLVATKIFHMLVLWILYPVGQLQQQLLLQPPVPKLIQLQHLILHPIWLHHLPLLRLQMRQKLLPPQLLPQQLLTQQLPPQQLLHVSTATTNWAGAVTDCEGLGAALATIENKALDTAITADIVDDTWIGLNDPTKTKTWAWSEDSSALSSYANWYGSNPGSNANQKCVLKKNLQRGEWDDVGCGKDIPYACTVAASCG
jgi:hypothetical protein